MKNQEWQIGQNQHPRLGLGWKVLKTIMQAISLFPETLNAKVAQHLDRLTQTGTAYVYRVSPKGCS